MVSINDESYKMLGAKMLLQRLQNLTEEIDGVYKAEDIESIHRMRVASRRIRSALRLFGKCFSKDAKDWEKQIRNITKALGAVRDLDVQMVFLKDFLDNLTETNYRPGIQRLLLRLRQRRESLQKNVIKTMERLKSSGLIDNMSDTMRQVLVSARLHHIDEYSPYVYQESYMAISLRLEEMLSYEIYLDYPERQEELHAMRIAAKRLRYTIEIFKPLYGNDLDDALKTVRDIQAKLGDIHDYDVWINYLPLFLKEEYVRTLEYFGHTKSFSRIKTGILYLHRECYRQREKLYKEFLEFWQNIQEQNLWNNFLERIDRSFSKT